MSAISVSAGRPAGLRGAVAYEWTKLTSLRSTAWVLLAAAAVMTVAASSVGVITHDPTTSPGEPAVFAALYGGGLIAAVLAMLAVTGEYATGGITLTLQCVPNRPRLLLAKCLTLGAVCFVVGVALGVLGAVVGAMSLDASTFRLAAVVGEVLSIGAFVALLAVLTVGLAFVVRSSAGVLTSLFTLLFVLPALLESLPGGFPGDVASVLPQGAATRLLVGPDPAVGLLLLTAWAAASALVGLRTFRHADA